MFILIIIIYSCKTNGIHLIKVYYPSGKLKIEEQVLADSFVNGFYKEYYDNGTLYKDYNMVRGKLSGLCKVYDKIGKIYFAGNYKDSLEDGNQVYYFDNGNIDEKYFAKKGLTIGQKFKYYPDGKMRQYWFYDHQGRAKYQRVYDSIGNLISSSGNPIAEYLLFSRSFKDAIINKNDTLLINIFCATPPNAQVHLYFKELNGYLPQIDLSDSIVQNYATPSFILNQIGNYKTKVVMSITNRDGTEEENYRVSAFTVK